MDRIPPVINYIWFGKKEKPEIVLNCIKSWKKFFPDYEIYEWNEDNYNVKQNDYMKEAYEKEKWAFVSDYARFDILYKNGGIYFDTDVEVIKPFPKEIFQVKGFTGVESTKDINPGLILAAVPGLPFLKKLIDSYLDEHYVLSGKENNKTVNQRVTELMQQDGYIKNGTIQVVNDITIYPSEYFCGYDLDVFESDISENTLCIHHYCSSWQTEKFYRKRRIQKKLKKLLGTKNYKTFLCFLRFLKNKKRN